MRDKRRAQPGLMRGSRSFIHALWDFDVSPRGIRAAGAAKSYLVRTDDDELPRLQRKDEDD